MREPTPMPDKAEALLTFDNKTELPLSAARALNVRYRHFEREVAEASCDTGKSAGNTTYTGNTSCTAGRYAREIKL